MERAAAHGSARLVNRELTNEAGRADASFFCCLAVRVNPDQIGKILKTNFAGSFLTPYDLL